MNFINKLGLGSVQFGVEYGISNSSGKTGELEVAAILDVAEKSGIDLIDTASAYGNSEEVLGMCDLTKFKVVSKFLLNEIDTLENQLKSTLKLLNQSSIYGYLAHRPLEVVEDLNIWEDLKLAKRSGSIEKIGFSFNSVEEIDKVLSLSIQPDIIQVPFNFLDRRFLNYMKDLKNKGCEIHTRSTFLQGLFFCDPNYLNSYFDEIKPILERFRGLKHDLPGLLLRWVTSQNFVDKVIIGVNDSKQLIENIKSISSNIKSSLPNYYFEVSDNILMPSNWPKK